MYKFHCTNCGYVYNPYIGEMEQEIEAGTDFEDIREDWLCPVCGETKDVFVELLETIHEPSEMDIMIPQEERHIPFYRIEGDKIYVEVGSEDEPFVQDDVHFVEYIALVDGNGDVIESKDFPDLDSPTIFDLPEDDFEVRASCTLHGVWGGIKKLILI